MKYIPFLFALCMVFTILNAQQITFEKNYGFLYDEYGNCIKSTHDHGYIVCGSSSKQGSAPNIILYKIDSVGNTVWNKAYGNGYPIYVTEAFDKGFLLICNQSGNLLKTDSMGNILWNKTYNASIYRVDNTKDSNHIAVGTKKNLNNDVFIAKLDSYGDTIWTKSYDSGVHDEGRYVYQTKDGGYFIASYTYNANIFDPVNIWYLKTNAVGDTLWTSTFKDSVNSNAKEFAQTTDDGCVHIKPNYPLDRVSRVDSIGVTLWDKPIPAPSGMIYYANSISQTNDKGFIIVGDLEDSLAGYISYRHLVRLNNYGDTLWTRTLDEGFTNWVETTYDNGLIITGDKYISSLSGYDIYVIKMDSLGKINITTNLKESWPLKGYIKIEPNPVKNTAEVYFINFESGFVTLALFNACGEHMRDVWSDVIAAGETVRVNFRTDNLSNGLYFLSVNKSMFYTLFIVN